MSGGVKKRIIVVLGMHRSGTSATTRALLTMGVALGDRLMPPIADVNDGGFWEDLDINALNIEMLKELGTDWHHLAPVTSQQARQLLDNGYGRRAVELLQGKVSGVQIFGFKDPRTAKLLPFWKTVLDGSGFDVGYVLALRNPMSVVKSLLKRDGFPPEKSYLLWLGHVLNILTEMQGERCVLVDYDRLLQSPDVELARVAGALALEIDDVESRRYQTEFLDQRLRHTVYRPEDLSGDAACTALVREIYDALREMVSDAQPMDASALHDAIARWTSEYDRIKPQLVLADKLTDAISERDVTIATLSGGIAERDVQIAALAQEVASLKASTSWRVTRPLRWLGRRVKRVPAAPDS